VKQIDFTKLEDCTVQNNYTRFKTCVTLCPESFAVITLFKANFAQYLKQYLNRRNDLNLVLSRLIQQTAGILGLL
jgi:hypothetical protein